jgi:hypothetical protein
MDIVGSMVTVYSMATTVATAKAKWEDISIQQQETTTKVDQQRARPDIQG